MEDILALAPSLVIQGVQGKRPENGVNPRAVASRFGTDVPGYVMEYLAFERKRRQANCQRTKRKGTRAKARVPCLHPRVQVKRKKVRKSSQEKLRNRKGIRDFIFPDSGTKITCSLTPEQVHTGHTGTRGNSIDLGHNSDMVERWKCGTCGEEHEGVPFSFAADFPDEYANMSREQRELRTQVSSDQCIVDGERFYVRGCLEIPIIGREERWIWGLWALVLENDFDQLAESWEIVGREKRVGPFKARLANSLKEYAPTLNLKITMRVQPVRVRPLFFVDEREHELAEQQMCGITHDQAVQMACLLMHSG